MSLRNVIRNINPLISVPRPRRRDGRRPGGHVGRPVSAPLLAYLRGHPGEWISTSCLQFVLHLGDEVRPTLARMVLQGSVERERRGKISVWRARVTPDRQPLSPLSPTPIAGCDRGASQPTSVSHGAWPVSTHCVRSPRCRHGVRAEVRDRLIRDGLLQPPEPGHDSKALQGKVITDAFSCTLSMRTGRISSFIVHRPDWQRLAASLLGAEVVGGLDPLEIHVHTSAPLLAACIASLRGESPPLPGGDNWIERDAAGGMDHFDRSQLPEGDSEHSGSLDQLRRWHRSVGEVLQRWAGDVGVITERDEEIRKVAEQLPRLAAKLDRIEKALGSDSDPGGMHQ